MLKSTITTLIALNLILANVAFSQQESKNTADQQQAAAASSAAHADVRAAQQDNLTNSSSSSQPNAPATQQSRGSDPDPADVRAAKKDNLMDNSSGWRGQQNTAEGYGEETFGMGTEGSNGAIRLELNSAPRVGNVEFSLTAYNAPGKSLGIALVAPAQAALDQGQDALNLGVKLLMNVEAFEPQIFGPLASDSLGTSVIYAPLFDDPALIDLKVVVQTVWLDSQAGIDGTLASSNAIKFKITL